MPLAGPPLDHPTHVPSLLLRGVADKPDGLALVSAETRWTWHDLDRATDRFAAQLLALGLKPGDRVASLMPNRTRCWCTTWPASRRGWSPRRSTTATCRRRSTTRWRSAKPAILLAHAERDADLARQRLAGGLPLGTHPLRRRTAAAGRLRRPASADDRRRATPAAAGRRDPALHLLHLGQHRAGQGRDAQLRRSAGWSRSQRQPAFELTASDVILPASSMSHIGVVPVLLRRARGRARGSSSPGRSMRARCCRCCASTGRRCWPCCRPRSSRWSGTTAPRPRTSRRCASAVAARDKVSAELEREFTAPGRLPHRRGLRHDRGRPGHVEPAVRRDPARLDRSADPGRGDAAASATTRAEVRGRRRRAGLDQARAAGPVGYWDEPGGDRGDPAGRLARLRRRGPGRRRRLPVVLRAQEADHRARRLEHLPARGGRCAARAPGGRARGRRRHPRRGARRERPRVRDASPRARPGRRARS